MIYHVVDAGSKAYFLEVHNKSGYTDWEEFRPCGDRMVVMIYSREEEDYYCEEARIFKNGGALGIEEIPEETGEEIQTAEETAAEVCAETPEGEIPEDTAAETAPETATCPSADEYDENNEADPVLNWEIADGWKYYNASTQAEGTAPEDFVNGTYYFYREVAKTEKTDTAPVFPVLKNNQVTVSPEVTKGMVTGLNTAGEQPTLTFTAAAVQSENLPDAATDNDDTTLTTLGVAFKQISWTA